MPHNVTIRKSEIADGKVHVYYREPGATEDYVHVFPADTPEWRVAEFDYDPTDMGHLIQVILAERWDEAEDSDLWDIDPLLGAQHSKAALVGIRARKEARRNAIGLNITPDTQWDQLRAKVPPVSEQGRAIKENVLFDVRARRQGKQVGRPVVRP